MESILSSEFINLNEFANRNKKKYLNAEPFPHIVIDNVFNKEFLDQVLIEFPNLSLYKNVKEELRFEEIKYVGTGEANFGQKTKKLIHFLNSEIFLKFIQKITSINEILISDPYLAGGGLHEIKKGGLLKIHSDFNKHPYFNLDRRINLLVYLNKDWKEEYGGHIELWDKEMKNLKQKILPIFNRVVIFSTTSYSYHGHPNPLLCPQDRSRKSIAMYYYSHGRPENEISTRHDTIFKKHLLIKNQI